jgi:hypothetical protein
MIFQQYRGHLLVVRQPDHGVQTGLFASQVISGKSNTVI